MEGMPTVWGAPPSSLLVDISSVPQKNHSTHHLYSSLLCWNWWWFCSEISFEYNPLISGRHLIGITSAGEIGGAGRRGRSLRSSCSCWISRPLPGVNRKMPGWSRLKQHFMKIFGDVSKPFKTYFWGWINIHSLTSYFRVPSVPLFWPMTVLYSMGIFSGDIVESKKRRCF